MRKENQNINSCHSREGGNPGQRYSSITTWIIRSSRIMTAFLMAIVSASRNDKWNLK